MEIKKIANDEVISAVQLVWNTMADFDQLSQPMKAEETVRRYFIEVIVDDYLNDELILIGAFIDNEIVGVIGSKENYINFFFVKKEHQNKKIGKLLMQEMLVNLKLKYSGKIEVDASSYAHDIYKHLGFIDEIKQIKCDEYSMVYELRRNIDGI